MATAPTPSASRRTAAAEAVLPLTVRGHHVVLRLGDLGPRDDQVCIQATGQTSLYFIANIEQLGAYGHAVVYWLARRQNGEPKLTLDTVLDDFPTYGTMRDEVSVGDVAEPEEDAADPLDSDDA